MEGLDKKSNIGNQIFYTIFVLLILFSVITTFIKIVVQKDYQIVAETSCNPQTEQCFVRTCDPTNDSTCPVQENERTTYYKKISKRANEISICETTTDKVGCNIDLSCTPNEVSCFYMFCDPHNLSDGETCMK